MALTRYRLGELIAQRREKYDGSQLPVRGVTRDGFIPPKQSVDDLHLYNMFYMNDFVFNPARMEINSIALNLHYEKAACSSLYEVFYVTHPDLVDPRYLNLFIKRDEFARLCSFIGWGSAREYCRVADISDIEIELPPIEVQRKYVAIYEAMCENQRCYEAGLEDLKLACYASIESLRGKERELPIGNFIEKENDKNTDGAIQLEQGINIKKEFITPQRKNSNLFGRKIVRRGQFAYCTQLNNENVAIAYREGEDCVVSSVYDVFEINKPLALDPHYLMLWLIRPEFGRFVYWASEGSAYEFLNYENLENYKIPIPSLEVQRSIADLFKAYNERKEINEKLKQQIRDLCPLLIKGSLEEASRA